MGGGANRELLTANRTRWSRRCRFGVAILFGSGSAGLATYPWNASKTCKKFLSDKGQVAQSVSGYSYFLQPPFVGHSGTGTGFPHPPREIPVADNAAELIPNAQLLIAPGGAGVAASVVRILWFRLRRVGLMPKAFEPVSIKSFLRNTKNRLTEHFKM